MYACNVIQKEIPAQVISCDFCEVLCLYAVLVHSCLCSLDLDIDLKVVIDKDQSSNIYDICHFEENMGKLFQEQRNIDASSAALLEFSKLVCFA